MWVTECDVTFALHVTPHDGTSRDPDVDVMMVMMSEPGWKVEL